VKSAGLVLLIAASLWASDTIEAFGKKWDVPVAADWEVKDEGGTSMVRMVQNRGPLTGVPRRPIQFALLEGPNYQRVTVEADVRTLGKSLLIAFAYRDSAHFNYAHLSTDTGAAQPVHNGIFHVFGGERVRISSQRGAASFRTSGEWYHVVLTHDASTGIVGVTVDGKAVPALDAVDLSLGPGRVGFGSFDEKAEFKNLKITGTPGASTAPPQ
jgi:hypothetical protein